jgi:hypothetical protein
VFANILLCTVKVGRKYGRKSKPVCCFDPRSPRISAYDIHEQIHETMLLREQEVAMVQTD